MLVRCFCLAPSLAVLVFVLGSGLAGCDACGEPSLEKLRRGLSVEPQSVAFADTRVTQERLFTLTLHNAGTSPVLVAPPQLTGPGHFVVVEPISLSLAPSASVELVLAFVPTQPGEHTASLILDSDADDAARIEIAVQGRALSVPACDDGNECTSDRFDFDLDACVFNNRSGSCAADNACIIDAVCVDGACKGSARVCEASVSCMEALCDPAQGCVERQRPDTCVDDDPCTDNVCVAARGCENPPSVDGTLCGAVVPCQRVPLCFAGSCTDIVPPDGSPCLDGDRCTEDDSCHAGACSGTPAPALGEVLARLPTPSGHPVFLGDGRLVIVSLQARASSSEPSALRISVIPTSRSPGDTAPALQETIVDFVHDIGDQADPVVIPDEVEGVVAAGTSALVVMHGQDGGAHPIIELDALGVAHHRGVLTVPLPPSPRAWTGQDGAAATTDQALYVCRDRMLWAVGLADLDAPTILHEVALPGHCGGVAVAAEAETQQLYVLFEDSTTAQLQRYFLLDPQAPLVPETTLDLHSANSRHVLLSDGEQVAWVNSAAIHLIHPWNLNTTASVDLPWNSQHFAANAHGVYVSTEDRTWSQTRFLSWSLLVQLSINDSAPDTQPNDGSDAAPPHETWIPVNSHGASHGCEPRTGRDALLVCRTGFREESLTLYTGLPDGSVSDTGAELGPVDFLHAPAARAHAISVPFTVFSDSDVFSFQVTGGRLSWLATHNVDVRGPHHPGAQNLDGRPVFFAQDDGAGGLAGGTLGLFERGPRPDLQELAELWTLHVSEGQAHLVSSHLNTIDLARSIDPPGDLVVQPWLRSIHDGILVAYDVSAPVTCLACEGCPCPEAQHQIHLGRYHLQEANGGLFTGGWGFRSSSQLALPPLSERLRVLTAGAARGGERVALIFDATLMTVAVEQEGMRLLSSYPLSIVYSAVPAPIISDAAWVPEGLVVLDVHRGMLHLARIDDDGINVFDGEPGIAVPGADRILGVFGDRLLVRAGRALLFVDVALEGEPAPLLLSGVPSSVVPEGERFVVAGDDGVSLVRAPCVSP